MTAEVPQYQIVPLSEIVRDSLHENHSLLVDIGEWALNGGRSMDREVIALILASKANRQTDCNFFHWTRVAVFTDLWSTAFNYCSIRRAFIPENIGEQMWVFLHYLHDTRSTLR